MRLITRCCTSMCVRTSQTSRVSGPSGRRTCVASIHVTTTRSSEIVQEGIDNGTIRPLTSARVIAFGRIGMVGWTNRWYVPDRSPESAETIGKAYAEMVLQGSAREWANRRGRRRERWALGSPTCSPSPVSRPTSLNLPLLRSRSPAPRSSERQPTVFGEESSILLALLQAQNACTLSSPQTPCRA